MSDKRTRPFRHFSRKYTFIILAVLSGIIGAIWVAIDTYTGQAIVVNAEGVTNEYAFAVQSMIIGLITSIAFALILWIPVTLDVFKKKKGQINTGVSPTTPKTQTTQQQPRVLQQGQTGKKKKRKQKRKYTFLGQWIDPQYRGIRLPSKTMLLWLSLSGLISGINTLIYFVLIKSMDLSMFLPASQFVVVYLLVGDLVLDKTLPCAVEVQSIIMIVLGVILAAIDFSTGGGLGNQWSNLLLVFLVLNTSAAIYVFFQKKAIETKDKNGRNMDSTNIRLWTLLFMGIFTTLFSLPFMGKEAWSIFASTFAPAFFPIALSMLLVFIARVLYVRALSMGKMSIVNSLASVSVIAGIPITFICSLIWPQYFTLATGWSVWLLRGMGAILVFTGIVALSMSEVKIMVLAKVTTGEICDINKIKSIPGVERVSAITGKYDLMIILRSRTIGKGYQPIVDQLARLPCLSVIVSHSILKEWNA